MNHDSYDANGSPIDNRNGDHLRQHADIEHESPAPVAAPFRLRQLDVSDEHVLELLTGVTLLLLDKRRNGTQPSMALLEMQGALNAMVSA